MPVGKRKTELVASKDVFAIELLEQAKTSESLADKIAAFEKIGRWIAIKNRLEDKDEVEGASLAALKVRIRGRPIHLTSEHQRAAALARWGKSGVLAADGNGGTELERIRGMVSRRDGS
jgi:hypothetical protein